MTPKAITSSHLALEGLHAIHRPLEAIIKLVVPEHDVFNLGLVEPLGHRPTAVESGERARRQEVACQGRDHHTVESSEVIRGYQRRSEVIRAHQSSSPAKVEITTQSSHQRSSEVIRGYQRRSEAIRGHQSSSPAKVEITTQSSHQRSSEVIRAHQSSSELIRAHHLARSRSPHSRGPRPLSERRRPRSQHGGSCRACKRRSR